MNITSAAPDVEAAPVLGVLLVRAWVEPGAREPLRARLVVPDDAGLPTTWGTAAGIDGICGELRLWLRQLQEGAGGRPPLPE